MTDFNFICWITAQLWVFEMNGKHETEAGRCNILILTQIFVISNTCKFLSFNNTVMKFWNLPHSDMLFEMEAVIFSIMHKLRCYHNHTFIHSVYEYKWLEKRLPTLCSHFVNHFLFIYFLSVLDIFIFTLLFSVVNTKLLWICFGNILYFDFTSSQLFHLSFSLKTP